MLGARWIAGRGDRVLRDAARQALAKIAAILPSDLREEWEDVPLLVGPGAAFEDLDELLSQLRLSIRNRNKLRLRYRSTKDETTERTVWPLALSYFDSSRLLVAWCEMRVDYRVFRCDRIASATMLGETYTESRASLLARWRERAEVPRQDLSFDS